MQIEREWEPAGDQVVTLRQRYSDGSLCRIKGIRVGRFAVRARAAGETVTRHRVMLRWQVTHIPSGTLIFNVDDFDDAMRLADDVSRFSAKDPSAKDKDRMCAQFGREVMAWLCAHSRDGHTLDFRTWRAQRAAQGAA